MSQGDFLSEKKRLLSGEIFGKTCNRLGEMLMCGELESYAELSGHVFRLPSYVWMMDFEKYEFFFTGKLELAPLFAFRGDVIFNGAEIDQALERNAQKHAFPMLDLSHFEVVSETNGPLSDDGLGAVQHNRNSAGRPTQYDGEAFLMEAFRIIFEDGFPETQADLRRRAIKAYVDKGLKGGAPTEEWAKPKIRKLWHDLGGRTNG